MFQKYYFNAFILMKLSFFTLSLLISFASVNAVLFTPGLTEITQFFAISPHTAQQTIIWFLIGYTLGQLIYGPITERLGSKNALYIGISIQIASSFLCILSGELHSYFLLIAGRFLLALGSGVGLKMSFTLVNEWYDTKTAAQKTSYLLRWATDYPFWLDQLFLCGNTIWFAITNTHYPIA
jgi:DHA1 family bicyclomycin/chloramphenicol resistance-like MFS transporter